MKITRPIEYIEVEKRLKENFNIDTDYDLFHKINGKIVVHFWDKKYLKNLQQKAKGEYEKQEIHYYNDTRS